MRRPSLQLLVTLGHASEILMGCQQELSRTLEIGREVHRHL